MCSEEKHSGVPMTRFSRFAFQQLNERKRQLIQIVDGEMLSTKVTNGKNGKRTETRSQLMHSIPTNGLSCLIDVVNLQTVPFTNNFSIFQTIHHQHSLLSLSPSHCHHYALSGSEAFSLRYHFNIVEALRDLCRYSISSNPQITLKFNLRRVCCLVDCYCGSNSAACHV